MVRCVKSSADTADLGSTMGLQGPFDLLAPSGPNAVPQVTPSRTKHHLEASPAKLSHAAQYVPLFDPNGM